MNRKFYAITALVIVTIAISTSLVSAAGPREHSVTAESNISGPSFQSCTLPVAQFGAIDRKAYAMNPTMLPVPAYNDAALNYAMNPTMLLIVVDNSQPFIYAMNPTMLPDLVLAGNFGRFC